MTAVRSRAAARSASRLLRCRLTWRSQVKAAPAAGRNHNRQLMRGGRE